MRLVKNGSFLVLGLTFLMVCFSLTLSAGDTSVENPVAPPAFLKIQIDALAKKYMDTGKYVGMVIGVIKGKKAYVLGYGETEKGNKTKPDGGTVFEIGSISKVFTTALLADMVKDGLIKLDDPIETVFPEGAKIADFKGKKITFQHLATHTSGLPRLSGGMIFSMKDQKNPYGLYTKEMLEKDLAIPMFMTEPGKSFQYSNYGVGVLGHCLSLKAKTDYEGLLKNRILDKLGMNDSSVILMESQKKKLAVGHTASGDPTPCWDLPGVPGAGAIKSNVNDMLSFLAANLGTDGKNPALTEVLNRCHNVIFEDKDDRVGLGWMNFEKKINGKDVVWHNGQTGGYASFAGMVKENDTAVVILTNSANQMESLGAAVLKLLDQ